MAEELSISDAALEDVLGGGSELIGEYANVNYSFWDFPDDGGREGSLLADADRLGSAEQQEVVPSPSVVAPEHPGSAPSLGYLASDALAPGGSGGQQQLTFNQRVETSAPIPLPVRVEHISTVFGVPAANFDEVKRANLPGILGALVAEFEHYRESEFSNMRWLQNQYPDKRDLLESWAINRIDRVWQLDYLPELLKLEGARSRSALRSDVMFHYNEYRNAKSPLGDAVRHLNTLQAAAGQASVDDLHKAQLAVIRLMTEHQSALNISKGAEARQPTPLDVIDDIDVRPRGCWDTWSGPISADSIVSVIEMHVEALVTPGYDALKTLQKCVRETTGRQWLPLFGIAHDVIGTGETIFRPLEMVRTDVAALALSQRGSEFPTNTNPENVAAVINVVALTNDAFCPYFGRSLVHVFPFNATSDMRKIGVCSESITRYGVRLASFDSLLFHGHHGSANFEASYAIVLRMQPELSRGLHRGANLDPSVHVFWSGNEDLYSEVVSDQLSSIDSLLSNHSSELDRVPELDGRLRFVPAACGKVSPSRLKKIRKMLSLSQAIRHNIPSERVPYETDEDYVRDMAELRLRIMALTCALEQDPVHAQTLNGVLQTVHRDFIEAMYLEVVANGWAAPGVTALGSLLTRMPRPDVGSVHMGDSPGPLLSANCLLDWDADSIVEYSPESLLGRLTDEFERWRQTSIPFQQRSKHAVTGRTDKDVLGSDVLWGPDRLMRDTANRERCVWYEIDANSKLFASDETFMVTTPNWQESMFYDANIASEQRIDPKRESCFKENELPDLRRWHGAAASLGARNVTMAATAELQATAEWCKPLPSIKEARMRWSTVFVDPLDHVFSDMIGSFTGTAGSQYFPTSRLSALSPSEASAASHPYVTDYRSYLSRHCGGGMFPFTAILPSNPCRPLYGRTTPRFMDMDVISMCSFEAYARAKKLAHSYILFLLQSLQNYEKATKAVPHDEWTVYEAYKAPKRDVVGLSLHTKMQWRRVTDFVSLPAFGPHIQPMLCVESQPNLLAELESTPMYGVFTAEPTKGTALRKQMQNFAMAAARVVCSERLLCLPTPRRISTMIGVLAAFEKHFDLCMTFCWRQREAEEGHNLRELDERQWSAPVNCDRYIPGMEIDVRAVFTSLFPVTEECFDNPHHAFKRQSKDVQNATFAIGHRGDLAPGLHGTGAAETVNTAAALDVGWTQAAIWAMLRDAFCDEIADPMAAARRVLRLMRALLMYRVPQPGREGELGMENARAIHLVVHLLQRRKSLIGKKRKKADAPSTLKDLMDTTPPDAPLSTFGQPEPTTGPTVCTWRDLRDAVATVRKYEPAVRKAGRVKSMATVECENTATFAAVAKFVRYCLYDLVLRGPDIIKYAYTFSYNGIDETHDVAKDMLGELASTLTASYLLFKRPTETRQAPTCGLGMSAY